MQKKLNLTKKIFVFEQYKQTSQRMMNVRKKQFKSFEISAEETGIISYYKFLLSILNAFTAGTEEYYPRCRDVYDPKGLQILYHDCNINLHLEVVNIKIG